MIDETLGHYRILAKIGEGGMGVVYRARDEVLRRDVAIKVLAAGSVGRVTGDHLLREAQTASALSHPNICTVHEVGQFPGGFYFVMELIDGRPLSELARSSGLTTEAVTRYGMQVADALVHAHERGVLHRDLKGANVVVTKSGWVKVLDFGLAKHLDATAADALTRSYVPAEDDGSLAGTLPYMAPEVLSGEPPGYPSDIWSLGVLLFEAAAGRLPFQGNTTFELTAAILREPTPALPASVPPGLAAVVTRCLAKDPSLRFQRALDVRTALEAIQTAAVIGQPADERPALRTIVLRGIQHLSVKNGDVLLLVGTNKGAFLVRSTKDRRAWDVGGPYFHGQAVYAMAYDGRAGRHRLWASTGSVLWGTYLRSTDDFGKTWTNPVHANVRFPAESGLSLKNVWTIRIGRATEPDTLYCGVDPAALFESRDAGETWSLVRGLFDHPQRPRWMPGQGGLCLHTVLPHPTNPERMHVAISAAGVYRTDDGGRSWQPRNRGIRVTFLPERYPEFGQCVHRVVCHADQPDRLFLQNHWGLYRSDDAGDNWSDIAHGLPSDFGFALAVHPHDPECVFTVPLESDEFRCTPEGKLRVYRTRDGGGSWEPLTRGLPQEGAYEAVLRDGLATDLLDPPGLYLGTRSGKLFASRDAGKSWKKLLDGLPQIVSLSAVVVNELTATRNGAAREKRPARKPKRPTPPKSKAGAKSRRSTKRPSRR